MVFLVFLISFLSLHSRSGFSSILFEFYCPLSSTTTRLPRHPAYSPPNTSKPDTFHAKRSLHQSWHLEVDSRTLAPPSCQSFMVHGRRINIILSAPSPARRPIKHFGLRPSQHSSCQAKSGLPALALTHRFSLAAGLGACKLAWVLGLTLRGCVRCLELGY